MTSSTSGVGRGDRRGPRTARVRARGDRAVRRRRRGDRFRDHRQPPGLPERHRAGARSLDALRSAVETASTEPLQQVRRPAGLASKNRRRPQPGHADIRRCRVVRFEPASVSAHAALPSGFEVTIDDPELCPRYAVALAEVTVGDVARLDGDASAGSRCPIDQLDRRHHQLRADRVGPSHSRVRPRQARRAGDSRQAGDTRASGSRRSMASNGCSTPRCWSSPTATARRRSPGSWAAAWPRCRRPLGSSRSRARTSSRRRSGAPASVSA